MALNFPSNPTISQVYSSSELKIHNTVVSTDKDYVTFTTGSDSITAIYLTKYVSIDQIAFFAIQAGAAWTAGQDITQMIAYSHFGPGEPGYGVGDNILALQNATLLANTQYTIWIQQTGTNLTEYVFSTNSSYTGETSVPSDYSSNPATPTNFGTLTKTQSWIWDGIAWNIQPPGTTLDTLSDVDVFNAANGQVLYYDGTSNTWRPLSLSSTFNGGTITGVLNIQNTTASSTSGNGALIVAGGTGIGGALHAGSTGTFASTLTAQNGLTVSAGGAAITGNSTVTGTLSVSSTTSFSSTITLRSASELRLNDTANDNYIAFKSPANLTVNTVYQFPATDGTAGYVLATNGAGALAWVAQSGGGGGGGTSNPPGGVVGNVQFNNNGSFGGVASLNYDSLTDTFSVYNVDMTGQLDADSTGTIINLASLEFATGVQGTAFTDDSAFSANSNSNVPTEAAVKSYVDDGLIVKANINDPTFTGTVGGITNTMVGLGNVENTALTTWTGSSSITTVGTLTNLSVAGNISVPTLPSQTTHATNKRYVDSRAIAMSIALS